MSDDKTKSGSPDRDRININEDYEVRYWTETLGVSESELVATVKAVGTSSQAVRDHLKR